MGKLSFIYPIIHFRFSNGNFDPVYYPAKQEFDPRNHSEGKKLRDINNQINPTTLYSKIESLGKNAKIDECEYLIPDINSVISGIGNTLYLIFEKETELELSDVKGRRFKAALFDLNWASYFYYKSNARIVNVFKNSPDRSLEKFIHLYYQNNLHKIDWTTPKGIQNILEETGIYLNLYPILWEKNNSKMTENEMFELLKRLFEETLNLKQFFNNFKISGEENFFVSIDGIPDFIKKDKKKLEKFQPILNQIISKQDTYEAILHNKKSNVILACHSEDGQLITFANRKNEKGEFIYYLPKEIFRQSRIDNNEQELPAMLHLYICQANRMRDEKSSISREFMKMDIVLLWGSYDKLDYKEVLDFLNKIRNQRKFVLEIKENAHD